MSVYRITKVINQTKYFSLMKKFTEKQINVSEQTELLQEFGFISKEELLLFWGNYIKSKDKVHSKFSELQNIHAVKQSVFSATEGVLKSNKVFNPTEWECWLLWINCNNGANLYCMNQTQYTYEDCILFWMNMCLASYSLCWMEAE